MASWRMHAINWRTNWNEFASDDFTNALQPYSRSALPSGKIRTATEMYDATRGTRYRGIYFEGAGGDRHNDWAYMEYVAKGNVACPQSDYKRYNAAPQNVTFCGYLVRQADQRVLYRISMSSVHHVEPLNIGIFLVAQVALNWNRICNKILHWKPLIDMSSLSIGTLGSY